VISVDFAHVTAPLLLIFFFLDSTQLNNVQIRGKNLAIILYRFQTREGRIDALLDSAPLAGDD